MYSEFRTRQNERMYQNKPLLWCDATTLYYSAFDDNDDPMFKYYDTRFENGWQNCDMVHALNCKGVQFFC